MCVAIVMHMGSSLVDTYTKSTVTNDMVVQSTGSAVPSPSGYLFAVSLKPRHLQPSKLSQRPLVYSKLIE